MKHEPEVLIPESLLDDLLYIVESGKKNDCFAWRYLMDALADRPKQTGIPYHNGTPHGKLYHQTGK